MKSSDFILAIVGPVSAIILSLIVSQFEGVIIENQCTRIAKDHNLDDAARLVMTRTTESAVTIMTFFPSVVAFAASLMAIVLTAPQSSELLTWMLLLMFVALLLFIAVPIYMMASLSFYEFHNRARRLFGGDTKRPGQKTYLQIIRSRLMYLNVALIIAAIIVYFSPAIGKYYHAPLL